MRAPSLWSRRAVAAGLLLLLALRAHAGGSGVPLHEIARVPIDGAPVALAVGRIDGHAGVGVVVLRADSSMTTLFDDGSGGLGGARTYFLGADVVGLGFGDVNGDGLLDAVVSAPSAGTVFTLLGSVDSAGFQPGGSIHAPWSPGALVLQDLDADRKPDLVVADLFFQGLVEAHGDGSGGFAFTGQYPGFVDPVALAVGDVNGDGVPDVAVADRAARTATALVRAAPGAPGGRRDTPLSGRPVAVALGDLDGDGRADAVFATEAPGGFTVLRGTGDGTLERLHEYAGGTEPAAIAIGDFDSDIIPDLAVADRGTGSIAIWHGVGDGSFTLLGTVTTGAGPVALVAADVNGDAVPDLVCANHDDRSVSVFMNTGPRAPFANIALGKPSPNPTRGPSSIPFVLAIASTVRCDIHDLSGRLVRRFADQTFAAGYHRITWDGRTDRGDHAESGLYFVRLQAGGMEVVARVVLSR
jgi:hypothetical protein